MRVRASYRGLRRRKQALPTSDHKHNKRIVTGTAIRTTGIRCKGLHAALGTQRRGPSPIYPIGVSPDEGSLNANRHKYGSQIWARSRNGVTGVLQTSDGGFDSRVVHAHMATLWFTALL